MIYPGRRHVLASAGALAATTLFAGATSIAAKSSPWTDATLFLRSARLDDHHLALQLRRVSQAHCGGEHVIQMATHAGFYAARTLLDQSSEHALIALLDDLDEVTIDRLLIQRGARDRTRHRVDRGALLLTARI